MSPDSQSPSRPDHDRQLRSDLEHRLWSLLSTRPFPKTACPSEIARAFTPQQLRALGFAGWRDLMPPIQNLLWELHAAGALEILQRGTVLPTSVRAEHTRGPIRIRMPLAAS